MQSCKGFTFYIVNYLHVLIREAFSLCSYTLATCESYQLEFESTYNVAEYEALILGLEAARRMKMTELSVFGDSELIVQQIRGIYQTKHPRMRAYRNKVWDIVFLFLIVYSHDS